MSFSGSYICNTFKTELAQGIHDFRTTGHTFKIALYDSTATIDDSTTAYTTTGEMSGTGYTAGGKALTNVNPALSGRTAILDFADPSWTSASFTVRGALIYNSSVAGNPAVCVIDFGTERSVSAGTFTVTMPVASATDAFIRITTP